MFATKSLHNKFCLSDTNNKTKFLRFNLVFILRGNKFAMLTREQGMGRNMSELVSWVSNRCCGAAGDYHHSYWPQPVFLAMNPRTSKASFDKWSRNNFQ